MKTNEIIKGAVSILGSGLVEDAMTALNGRNARTAMKEDVLAALGDIAFVRNAESRLSAKGKDAARDLSNALRKLQLALKNENLFPLLRDRRLCGYPFMSHDDPVLVKWAKHAEAVARKGSEKWQGEVLETAAHCAGELMLKYQRNIVTTNGSDFLRLAALLSGNPKANLNVQCRGFVKSLKPKTKTRTK